MSDNNDGYLSRVTKYPLYVVTSNEKISDIVKKIDKYAKELELVDYLFTQVRIFYKRDRADGSIRSTDKSLVMITPNLANKLINDENSPFHGKIQQYAFNKSDKIIEGTTKLFVTMEYDRRYNLEAHTVLSAAHSFMSNFEKMKLLTRDNYFIFLRKYNRDTDSFSGSFNIIFKDVDAELITIVRSYMNYMFLFNKHNYLKPSTPRFVVLYWEDKYVKDNNDKDAVKDVVKDDVKVKREYRPKHNNFKRVGKKFVVNAPFRKTYNNSYGRNDPDILKVAAQDSAIEEITK